MLLHPQSLLYVTSLHQIHTDSHVCATLSHCPQLCVHTSSHCNTSAVHQGCLPLLWCILWIKKTTGLNNGSVQCVDPSAVGNKQLPWLLLMLLTSARAGRVGGNMRSPAAIHGGFHNTAAREMHPSHTPTWSPQLQSICLTLSNQAHPQVDCQMAV